MYLLYWYGFERFGMNLHVLVHTGMYKYILVYTGMYFMTQECFAKQYLATSR